MLNPLSSAGYLDQRFKDQGFYTLACVTSERIRCLVQPSIDHDYFDQIVFLTENFEQDIKLIQQICNDENLELELAFASSECDLPYADKIVNFFFPHYANPPETSLWRCNKRSMNQRLHANNTPASNQQVVTNAEDIDWAQVEYPVVVKPAEGGAASVGVYICLSREEVEEYFATLDQKNWMYQFKPNQFLVEEYLLGEEYIADMVAWDSQYFLIGVYSSVKDLHGAHKICRYRELLSHDDPVVAELFPYCCKVLENLDVRYGIMHLECIVTAEGPRLIELNPRVSGSAGMLNYFAEALTGNDQAATFINCFQSQKALPAMKQYNKNGEGALFYLQNFGFSYSSINEKLFTELESYHYHEVKIPQQPKPRYPENLLDTVAFVILAHPSSDQVARDLQQLREWEKAGEFFKQL